MEIINTALEKYIHDHTTIESYLLKSLERDTYANVLMPRMLSGKVQGRMLSMLSKMIRPLNILEIGTFTGYSSICLAEGLAEGGKLVTIDINEELEDMVRKYFKEAGVDKIIDYKIGNALEIIPLIDIMFDIVFIDADKINYPRYFELVINKIKPGGYLIADNVLWSGKVIHEDPKDKDLISIQKFNNMVQEDARLENLIVPLRDGLMLARMI